MNALENEVISVSLLTGFLGSGKTTLLNYLLAHPDMDETAVLINEFGEIGLDHLIVQRLDDDMVLLKSGCICCTVQGQLVDGLKELYVKRLADKIPPFRRLVIETTGLADPLPIIDCLMRDPFFKRIYRLDTVVTTVDAAFGDRQLETHDEAVHQAMVADTIIVTKQDLVNESQLFRLHKRLRDLNPGATVIDAQFGRVSPKELFGAGYFDLQHKSLNLQRWQITATGSEHPADDYDRARVHDHDHVDVSRHDARIGSFCIILDEPVPWDVVNRWLGDLAEKKGDQLLRVKGILDVEGVSTPVFVHCVQSTIHDPEPLPSWPDDDRRSRIVFITMDLPRDQIEDSLRATLAAARSVCRPGGTPSRVFGSGASRWLNPADLSRLFAALLSQHDASAANAIRLMLLTGVNREEARLSHWGQFNLNGRVWQLPIPAPAKQRIGLRSRRVVLHDLALQLLNHLRQFGAADGYLFGGAQPDISAERLSDIWAAAARRAGIAEFSLADLPPTLAIDVFDRLSPQLVQALLGVGRKAAA